MKLLTTTRPGKMLMDLGNWASNTQNSQHLQDQQEILEELQMAYLTSYYADNQEKRIEVLLLLDNLNRLFDVLARYEEKDYRAVDKILLQHHSKCTTETI